MISNILELKRMFETINRDCDIAVPFTDVSFYEHQVYNILFDNIGEVDEHSELTSAVIAQQLLFLDMIEGFTVH